MGRGGGKGGGGRSPKRAENVTLERAADTLSRQSAKSLGVPEARITRLAQKLQRAGMDRIGATGTAAQIIEAGGAKKYRATIQPDSILSGILDKANL